MVASSCTAMLTLWVGALESLVNFCTLFPDIAIDMNSIPATTQNVSLPLPSSAQSWLELGRPCEGRSSIKTCRQYARLRRRPPLAIGFPYLQSKTVYCLIPGELGQASGLLPGVNVVTREDRQDAQCHVICFANGSE